MAGITKMDRVTESSSSAKESTWEMSGISSLSSQVDSAKIQKSPSTRPIRTRGTNLEDVFSENILAKILQVAQRGLETEVCNEKEDVRVVNFD